MSPKISLIFPVYNTRPDFLNEAIFSVLHQGYTDWELCIACSTDGGQWSQANVQRVHAATNDPRVKVVFTPAQGISANSNAALELATGDYVAFLDCDDTLDPNALGHIANAVVAEPDLDFIYSDEDKIGTFGGNFAPYYKPDWSPDTFMSKMYTCHFSAYRTSLVKELGGLREQYDGAQDYDLVLRVMEKTDRIHHIPAVLYHWRIHETSTAGGAGAKPEAHTAAVEAIHDALSRRGEAAIVEPSSTGHHNVRYLPVDPDSQRVSIIIPIRDNARMTDNLLRTIYSRTHGYSNFEVIVVDNGSVEPETAKMLEKWADREPDFRVIRDDRPFNFGGLNNMAAREATGNFLLFLNNDMVVLSPEWLRDMVGYAQRESIGAVGAKLLFADSTVQHAGVILGPGGVAGHPFSGASDHEHGYYSQLSTVTNYSAVTGACLMVRREVFEEVEGFEERLAVAFNDIDLCIRIRNSGYNNVYLPFVKLFHFESKSRGYEDTPEKRARFDREAQFMKNRWGQMLINDPFYSRHLSLDNPYHLR